MSEKTRLGNALLALFMSLLLVAAGLFWVRSRSRGKASSRELYGSAIALSACVDAALADAATLREALELSPADSTPIAGCGPLAARAKRELGALAALPFPKDKEGIRELQPFMAALPEARFGERADTLAAGEVESLESGLGALLKGACRLAIAEGSQELGSCPPKERVVPARSLPEARVLLDEPAEFLQRTPYTVEAGPDSELRFAFATLERDSESLGILLGRSKDGGATLERILAARLGRADGAPDAPVVSFEAGAPRLVLVTTRDDKGKFKSAWVAQVAASADQLEPALEVPALPEGHAPLRAGTALWLSGEKQKRRPTLAIGPSERDKVGGALVRLQPGGKLELVPAPAGTLLAATTEPRPSLFVREPSGALAFYDVPPSGEKWPPARSAGLATGFPLAEPVAQAPCGPETSFPFVLREKHEAHLVTAGPAPVARRFEVGPELDLRRVCGGCSPLLLARAEDSLKLVMPADGRMLTLDAGAPLLVTSARATKHSVATCRADTLLVAHLAGGRVFVQTAPVGTARFGRPILLAAPNREGTPMDLRVAASGGRLAVFWRRDQRMRLLIETLGSDDGGQSWK